MFKALCRNINRDVCVISVKSRRLYFPLHEALQVLQSNSDKGLSPDSTRYKDQPCNTSKNNQKPYGQRLVTDVTDPEGVEGINLPAGLKSLLVSLS